MTTDLDRPFSSDLSLIKRLNCTLQRGTQRDRLTLSAARAPLRVDVPLLDPCSGHLSAGSGASLGRKNPPPFICLPHVYSDLRVPPGLRARGRTAHPRMVSLSLDMSPEKDWNSRRVHHSALRAWINANPDEDPPHHEAQAVSSGIPLKSAQEESVSPEEWISEAVRHYTYTSATQRSYEEVNWDRKLPRRLKAPDCTLEKTADAVRKPSSRRYYERPQLWQSVGAEWNRRQICSQEDVRKPISFCSGCPRSGQIPLYTGVIGSTNPEDRDNADRPFTPLTVRRSVQPPYTPTSRRMTIPGYTGRAVYADSAHVKTSDRSSPVQSLRIVSPDAHPQPLESRRSHGGRSAPLSRMLTTTSPKNPFIKSSSSHRTRDT